MPTENDKPFYTHPAVIAAIIAGVFLLLATFIGLMRKSESPVIHVHGDNVKVEVNINNGTIEQEPKDVPIPEPSAKKALDELSQNITLRNRLNDTFRLAYDLFSIGTPAHAGPVHVPAKTHPNFNVAWETGKILRVTRESVTLLLPRINYKTIKFYENVVRVPRKPGYEKNFVVIGEYSLIVKVIASNENLIICAVGIDAKRPSE